jgi:hypothetical protein
VSTDENTARNPSGEIKDRRSEVTGSGKDGESVDAEELATPGVGEVARETPWYRRSRNLAVLGMVAVAVIAAVVFAGGRESTRSTPIPSASEQAEGGPSRTLKDYVKENQITQTAVRRGDQGSPDIYIPLPWGWYDAGADTPEWAYGELLYKWPGNLDEPPNILILLSKLTGNVDPAKVLEFSTGELKNLPDYTQVSDPYRSQLSGFDAVQLAGVYKRDGLERLIAQKTVVIPSKDGLYVLQMNADAAKTAAPTMFAATHAIDEQTKITPQA